MTNNETTTAPTDIPSTPTATLPFDPTTLNAADAIDMIQLLNPTDPAATTGYFADRVTLLALIEVEAAHPKFEGGRKTVIDALELKLGELDAREEAAAELAAEAFIEGDEAGMALDVGGNGTAARIPFAGEQDWHARIGQGLLPVEIIGTEQVYRVRTLEGHPREVLVERLDLMPRPIDPNAGSAAAKSA